MDIQLFWWINGWPHPALVKQLSLCFEFLGNREVVAGLVALWFLISLFLKDKKNRDQSVCFAGTFLLTAIAVLILKDFFNRTRPYLAMPNVYSFGKLSDGGSFPSGHAMAFGAWAVFVKFFKKRGQWAWFVLAFAGGISRIYQGMHFPSDVLAGWALGALFSGVIYLACHKRMNRV